MEGLSFTIHGNPSPKGSLTRMPNGGMVGAGTAASRKRQGDWRTDVKQAALQAMGERQPTRDPIRLMVDFMLPYPQSSVRKYQLGWLPCTKKPDIDKLLRALLDPMTGVVWVDDAQVVTTTMNKSYAWDGQTGATVTIDFLDEGFCRRIGESRSILLKAMAAHGVT